MPQYKAKEREGMSYLEMGDSPLPDMTSGIISFWFREIKKQEPHPPPAKDWPQGFWTEANANTVMVPPNAQYSITNDAAFKSHAMFFNPYGLKFEGTGGAILGDKFLGPASVWIPNSPPDPFNTMSGNAGGHADTDMSKFGIRTLLVFGNPDIDYEYCTWRAERPGVTEAVEYLPTLVGGAQFQLPDWPPPYIPYYGSPRVNDDINNSHPSAGKEGKFTVGNYRLNDPEAKGKVPPSFIGIDNEGRLVINLQTNTSATYKGMSFELKAIHELAVTATYLKIRVPFTYTQLGFPLPDGDWIAVPGYWNGYEFEYKDISQEIMGAAPESFLIFASTQGIFDALAVGPTVKNGGWHHLLFSFDISGSVSVDQTDPANPVVESNCKAWLAFDDQNYTGENLQNRPPCHDGSLLPQLRGTHTSQLLDGGPCTTYKRSATHIAHECILPRNAWLHGRLGKPKDGLRQFAAATDLITPDNTTSINNGGVVGDFDWRPWTGSEWPLYGAGVAPGPWQATFQPQRPTVPDPKTFDSPSYFCEGFSIPTKGHPIGIPCSSSTVTNNTGVEMAELQIWANRSVDAGLVNIRRLFIDKEGKPVSPAVAEEALGKPDIMLHGSQNWIKGKNTGAMDVDIRDQRQHFTRVADIQRFKPEPELKK